MLLRIDPANPAAADTLQACGNAVTDLSQRRLIALIEPFMIRRGEERVAEASTLPSLLLGGDVGDKPDEIFGRWRRALSLPGVRGLVAGHNLLYPRMTTSPPPSTLPSAFCNPYLL